MYGGRRYPGSSGRNYNGGRDYRPKQGASTYKRVPLDNDSRPASSASQVKPEKANAEYPPNQLAGGNEGQTTEGEYPYQEPYVEADAAVYDESAVQEAPVQAPTETVDAAFKEQSPSGAPNGYDFGNVEEPVQDYSSKLYQDFGGKKAVDVKPKAVVSDSRPKQTSSKMPETSTPSLPNVGVSIVSSNGKRMVDLNSLIKPNESKFSGRARLFVANLQNVISEDDLMQLFSKFGETNEVYVNREKGYGFVRLDYRINAEIARNALDGYIYKGRYLKVRFAAHQSAIEIHGVDRFCSNESLEQAFGYFGSVERATIVCDERGKSKGYAIVEFGYKKSARMALQKINEGLFVLGRLPKPVTAKPLSQTDEDGIHDKDLERVPGIMKDREYSSRFIMPDSSEYEVAKRWKERDSRAESQLEELKKHIEEDREKLEVEIETAVHESEADYIRQELLQRQAALEEEIRRYDEMRNKDSFRKSMHQGHRSHGNDFNSKRNEEARRQDEFIRKQQQELLRRHGAEDMMREMQNAAATVGMAGINPAAALAMASGGPASAAAANILQAHAAVTHAMRGRDSVMQRMSGPRSLMQQNMMPPRGMMGPGAMHQRAMFDPGHGPGNIRAGMRRQGSRENFFNSNNHSGNKRPRN